MKTLTENKGNLRSFLGFCAAAGAGSAAAPLATSAMVQSCVRIGWVESSGISVQNVCETRQNFVLSKKFQTNSADFSAAVHRRLQWGTPNLWPARLSPLPNLGVSLSYLGCFFGQTFCLPTFHASDVEMRQLLSIARVVSSSLLSQALFFLIFSGSVSF